MQGPEPDFKTLLIQVQEGNEDAALTLFEQYGPAVRTVVRRTLQRRLRRRYDSEDLTQDVWASFFANPPSPNKVERPEALFGLLARIARNKVLDVVRRETQTLRRNLAREKSLDGSAAWVLNQVPGVEPTPSTRAAFKEKWEKLSSRDRRILELLLDGTPRGKIAAELHVDLRVLREVIRNFFWGDRP